MVFWIFWRKWFPEQQSIKLNMGVGAPSERSKVKQFLWSFCGGSGKTEFIEGGSGVLHFLQELIPWAGRCETKHGSSGFLWVFYGKAFTLIFFAEEVAGLNFLRGKWCFEFFTGCGSLGSKFWNWISEYGLASSLTANQILWSFCGESGKTDCF